MLREKPNINVDKLRDLMRRRNAANRYVVGLSDQFTELRHERQRMESHIKNQRRKPTRSERAEIESLRQKIDQINADRTKASRDFHDYSCVPALAGYAKKLGFRVDENLASVVWPEQGAVRSIQAPL